MHNSVIGLFYDLLSYHQKGSYHQLVRSFHASLRCIGLSLPDEELARWRRRSVRFLNAVGLVDIDTRRTENLSWQTRSGYLWQQNDKHVVCVGGGLLTRAFYAAIGEEQITWHATGYQPASVPRDIAMYPHFARARSSEKKANQVANELDIQYLVDPAAQIVQNLPALDSVVNAHTQAVERLPDEVELERFNFEDSLPAWRPVGEQDLIHSGLIRCQRIGGRYDYFVVVSLNHIVRIECPEWSTVLASFLLKQPINGLWDRANQLLAMPSWLMFPTLIERLLMAKQFTLPLFTKPGYRIYGGMEDATVSLLSEKTSLNLTECAL
ncbi:hypothetical protein [Microbulbifer rhizosphaerae]|uniref:Uncharacterized protein n=1 Tax=Microbulbifer rhizosphaerae TaxID=1562603 RepID=A0A7W4W7P8_9GAMM|nr:hypothetical protein [Microbulbifer rhizosphaerae]MBB3059240.1 hypothetical protein [Microbulbifer rhizosphaerae]